MAITIDLPEELQTALIHKAVASGKTESAYVQDLLREVLGVPEPEPKKSSKSMYGMWKKYGVSISDEDIDENRREMFAGFGERDDI